MATGTIKKVIGNSLGNSVDITNYNSSNQYTTPSNGYIVAQCGAQTQAFTNIVVNDKILARAVGVTGAQASVVSVLVSSGMRVYCNYDGLGGTHNLAFIPIT